ncbi:MAG: hypothetical protein WAM69_06945, partial [Candidatus Sulfotelmatobacter sp.]
ESDRDSDVAGPAGTDKSRRTRSYPLNKRERQRRRLQQAGGARVDWKQETSVFCETELDGTR